MYCWGITARKKSVQTQTVESGVGEAYEDISTAVLSVL
jgi:hypothetical protein